MIDNATFKRERRRLAIAANRADRARRLVPANPYSNELEGKGLELVAAHWLALERLELVAAEGLEIFEREGFPDSWANWERARDDARFAMHRLELDGAEHPSCIKHGTPHVVYADGSSLCARCYLERGGVHV